MLLRGAAYLSLILALSSCDQVRKTFNREDIPDLGPPIAMSAKIDLDPSVANARAEYTDNCGHLQVLSIGPVLDDMLLQAANQTFKSIVDAPGQSSDVMIRIRLLNPAFSLKQDALYDRAPAELGLDAFVEYRDQTGKVLAEQPLHITHQQRLRLEAMQKNCDYITSDMVHDASAKLATAFVRDARAILASQAPTSTALLLKATALDTNNNGVWETGERVRIRVDLTNGGQQPVQAVTIKLGAPAALVTPFGAGTISVGPLGPGESRAVEFPATVPAGLTEPQQSFTVTATDSTGASAPPASVVASLAPAAAIGRAPASDEIDAVPAGNGLQRPQVFLVSVGITAHRDAHMNVRKFAAADAELVTAYLQALGGVLPANVRLLQDKKAGRPDIEEAILDWLPSRVAPESLVVVYFSGQAKVTPAGDVFLVPFEGGSASTARLYPLKDLHAALDRLKARHVLLVFDGPASRLGDGKGRSKDPQWDAGGGHVIRLIAPATGAVESEKLKHGLFTYRLVRGLRGEADENLNGEVTLGELTAYLQQEQTAAPVPVSSRSAGVVLTKTR